MKKTFLLMTAALLFSGAFVFAQADADAYESEIDAAASEEKDSKFEIKFGASVDIAVIPFQLILNNDTDPSFFGGPEKEAMIIGAGAGRNASGQSIRARIEARASYNDMIGLRARIQARPDIVGIEDYLQAWWKPFPWMRLDIGRFFDDRLRGEINDQDERMHAYTVRMYDADGIFTRFRTHWNGQAGIMFSFSLPVHENFWFGAMLYDLMPFTSSNLPGNQYDSNPDLVIRNEDAYHRIQAAIAYKIPKVGLIRVQYFGAKPHVGINIITDEIIDDAQTTLASYAIPIFSITAPRIEAAFALSEIPGLLINIGGKVPLPFKNWEEERTNIFDKVDESLLDPIYAAYRSGLVWQAPYHVALGLRFSPVKLSSLEIACRADAKFGGSVKGHTTEVYFAPEVNFHFWPSWEFSFARLILNFGYEYIGRTFDNNDRTVGEGTPAAMTGGHRIGIGISLQKNIISNCYIKAGIAYKFAGTVNGTQEKAVLTIPLYAEYSF